MKIESEFKPITITLETLSEVKTLREHLHRALYPNDGGVVPILLKYLDGVSTKEEELTLNNMGKAMRETRLVQ